MSILDDFSLRGKVALVTGGAGPQYGHCITAGLAEAGAQTYVASRNSETVERVAAEHRERGHDVSAVTFDQADEASVLALRDHILRRSGHIDVLVNNAVLRTMFGEIDADAAAFARSLEVNATGLFVITRAFAEAMAGDRGGSIINIGSIYGMVGQDPTNYRGTNMRGSSPEYAFAKSGMIGMTRYFASHYGPKGVRVNCVCPGGYHMPHQPELFCRQYSEHTMLGRQANESDLKGIVVFLASDASAYVTATTIPLDGGYTAK